MDNLKYYLLSNSSTGQIAYVVSCSTLVLEVIGSNPGPVRSNTELPTARHRCDISSKGAIWPMRNVAAKGFENSLLVWRYTWSKMKI